MSDYVAIESDEVPAVSQNTAPTPAANAPASNTTTANAAQLPWIERLKESAHPVCLVFYIFFRISPLFIYIFGDFILGFITSKNRFVLHFIILILLISADFWNLKNVAGRLLVGLRWWNEVNLVKGSANGDFENVWVFETADPNRFINPIDSNMFWTLLYVQPAVWVVLGVLAVLKFLFLYLLLIIIASSLSIANAVAFTKCDKFGKANQVATDLFSRATGNVFSRLNPFAS